LIPSISDMPHKYVTLRSFEEDDFCFVLMKMVKELERIDEGRAFNEAHPGAVYYFEG